MKVLFITSFLPKKNAAQAGVNFTYNIIKLLNRDLSCNVDLLGTLNENEKEDSDNDILNMVNNKHFYYLNKKCKIKNIIKSPVKPIITSVRYDKRVINKIKELRNIKYDLIFLDYTQNIAYISVLKKVFKNSKIILLEQDVSFLGLERKINNSKGIKKILYKQEYKRLKRYEISKIQLFDKVFTVNEKDRQLLGCNKNVQVLYPYINNWNVSYKKHKEFNIMFWGAMNRLENEDAVINFIENIWPKVKQRNTKLYIIGSKPSNKILELANDNIIVTGFVEDPKEYFENMDISIVPLRLGAGIKIKVLESMTCSLPVVMTSVGAEGIDIVNEKEAFITDDNDKFAKYINELKDNEDLKNEVGINAYNLIQKKYNFELNKTILKNLFND